MTDTADNLLVTARLVSGLGGHEPPKLDALLEYALSPYHPGAVPRHMVDRALPAPPMGAIPIPLLRRRLGLWVVGCCSDPIVGVPAADYHEHVNKRLATEEASLLAPESRLVVSTTNSWTKSYRIPIRRRCVAAVCWFAIGSRREMLRAVRHVKALGKKVSIGNGRIAEWTVERIDHDYSWFAPSPDDPTRLVLMRTLPIGPWLPMDSMIGWRRDFGGVCPPYWHPERGCEVVRPA
jgi:hypothetical protein